MTDTVHKSGKRKTAKARATINEGEGTLRVNGRPLRTLDEQVSNPIKEPLIIAGEDVYGELDIEVTMNGGGIKGQAEAARMAIARAIVEYTDDEELEREFRDYDRNMMVEDPRRTETRKPSQSSKGARHKQQKSYR